MDISIWDLGPGPDGHTSIAFEARNGKGSLCLGEGRAYVIKKKVLPETNPLATAYDPSTAPNAPKKPEHVANGPELPRTPWDWVDTMWTLKGGIPIRVVLTVLFFVPAIIADALYVILSYWLTWWWQW